LARLPLFIGAISGLIGVGAGLGAGLALGLWALVGDYEWGWRALALLQSLPLVYLSIRIWWPGAGEYLPESKCFAPPKEGGFAAFRRPIASLFLNPRSRSVLIRWSFYTFAFQVTGVAAGQYLFVHLTNDCGYSATSNSLVTLLAGAIGMPLVLLTGVMSDRIGRIPTAQICWMLGGLSYSWFYTAPCDSMSVILGFIAVVCIPQFCRIAMTNTISNEIWQTEHRNLAGAVVGIVGSLSGTLGYQLFVTLASKVGHRHAEAWLGLAASVLLPMLLWFVPETSGVEMNNLNDEKDDAESHQDRPKPSSQYGSLDVEMEPHSKVEGAC